MSQVEVLVVSFKIWGCFSTPSTYLSTALTMQCRRVQCCMEGKLGCSVHT